MLGPDARAVLEYQRLVDEYKLHKDPELFRTQAVHLIAVLIEQLRTGVPYDYKPFGSPPTVFLGHGRSAMWLRVEKFLGGELGLQVQAFETESHTSQHIIDVLSGLLASSDLAVIVLTAEDITAHGAQRARQNVVRPLVAWRSGTTRTPPSVGARCTTSAETHFG